MAGAARPDTAIRIQRILHLFVAQVRPHLSELQKCPTLFRVQGANQKNCLKN